MSQHYQAEANIIADAIREAGEKIAEQLASAIKATSFRQAEALAEAFASLGRDVGDQLWTGAEQDQDGASSANLADGLFTIGRALERLSMPPQTKE